MRRRRTLFVGLTVLTAAAVQLAVSMVPAHANSVPIPPNQFLFGIDHFPGSTAAAKPERDDFLYRVLIQSDHGVCLDADSDTVDRNGGKVQVWSCNDSENQKWRIQTIEGVSGLFQIRTLHNEKCLDADNSAGRTWTRVQVWQCLGPGQRNQFWWLVAAPDGTTQLVNDAAPDGLCLSTRNLQRGTDLELLSCAGQVGQLWQPWDGTPFPPPPPPPWPGQP